MRNTREIPEVYGDIPRIRKKFRKLLMVRNIGNIPDFNAEIETLKKFKDKYKNMKVLLIEFF